MNSHDSVPRMITTDPLAIEPLHPIHSASSGTSGAQIPECSVEREDT